MSGLCGWLKKAGNPDPSVLLLDRMAAVLPGGSPGRTSSAFQHGFGLALRGNRQETSWIEDDGLCASIIGYPRWTDDELRLQAHSNGHAATLLAAYRQYGRDLLDKLQGHFVFAILEPGKDRAFCAIDRFGVYRLCYMMPQVGDFAFATSTDALRAYPGVGATVSPQTLYQYLYFIDRVAAPDTIYDEQKKLRAGEAIFVDGQEVSCWRYWTLDYSRPSSNSRSELHQALRDRLEQAVAHSLESADVEHTASFLSGGLDSSTVTGYFAKLGAGRGQCVTIGFQHADFDETKYAEIAAREFGLKHEVFMVGPQDVLSALPLLSAAFDEPYSNSSAIPCYYCAKVSREAGDEMILAGDGGDELFGGNTRYLKDDVFDLYRLAPRVLRDHLLEPLITHFPRRDRISLLRRAHNYMAMARRSVADRMTCHNAFTFVSPDRIFAADALAAIDLAGPQRFAESLYADAPGTAKIQKMMSFDIQLTLADSDLRKVMTSCDAAGMRVRFPMLDDDLAAFSATVPPALLTENGRIRQFYKDAMKGFLPQATIEKSKQGFGLPMFQYIAESRALADFFCDALNDLKRREFFVPAFLETLIGEIRHGRPETNAGIVWDLAVLETWMASRSIPVK